MRLEMYTLLYALPMLSMGVLALKLIGFPIFPILFHCCVLEFAALLLCFLLTAAAHIHALSSGMKKHTPLQAFKRNPQVFMF